MNEIRNSLVVPVEDPASNIILCTALEVCNTGGHHKKKLKPHLIVCLCSIFRMLIVDSIRSWPTVDDGSVLRRMCTTRLQRATTLVLGRAMLPRRAPLLPHTTTTKTLTWASTSTQLWMCCHSLRMLPTPSILHRPCRVNEHDNLRAVSLHDLVLSFITNAVIIFYYLTLVVSL
jgi:hypothetical protein